MTESNQPERESGATQLHSNWWRLQAVYFEPSRLFEEIAQRPNWLLPLLLVGLATALSVAVLLNVVGMESVVRQNLAQSSQYQEANAQKQQEMLDGALNSPIAKTIFKAAPLFPAIAIWFITLVMAGILMVALLLAGKQLQFSKLFSVCCHSFLATSLISSPLLMIVALLASDPAQLDLQNPLQSNLGFLVDAKQSPALHSLASSLDFFSLYAIFLLSLGISKITKRTSLGGAMSIVGGLWLVWVIGKTAWAAIF